MVFRDGRPQKDQLAEQDGMVPAPQREKLRREYEGLAFAMPSLRRVAIRLTKHKEFVAIGCTALETQVLLRVDKERSIK
jgi:hypothetical protein